MHEELVKVEQFAIIEQQINDMIRLHEPTSALVFYENLISWYVTSYRMYQSPDKKFIQINVLGTIILLIIADPLNVP